MTRLSHTTPNPCRRFARQSDVARGVQKSIRGIAALATLLVANLGCRPENMAEQPRYENLEYTDAFSDGMVARQPVPGTIAREGPLPGDLLSTGLREDGTIAIDPPMPVDQALLERGRSRYQIFCSVCHGKDGYGSGIVARRGFPSPPSFHDQRLRNAPIGYFVHVIQNGYGTMYPYADRVPPEDRWAIAAYLRVLQFSQRAEASQLPAEDRQALEELSP